VGADPILQLLARSGFSVSIVAGPQDGHEDRSWAFRTRSCTWRNATMACGTGEVTWQRASDLQTVPLPTDKNANNAPCSVVP
jgi:hypothetical protein